MEKFKNNLIYAFIMERKIAWVSIIAIILALGLVSTIWKDGNEARTLTADGTAETAVAPDEAVLYIYVETKTDSALESQRQNSEITDIVISSLSNAGIADGDIETNTYRVFPEYSYFDGRERTLTGYTTSHGLKVTTIDIDKVGLFVDAASQAGANRFDNIQFKLSDGKLEDAKLALLADASKNARTKAQAMADAVGVKLGKIKSVTESMPGFFPVYAETVVAELSPRTPIQPSKVELEVTVTLVYEI